MIIWIQIEVNHLNIILDAPTCEDDGDGISNNYSICKYIQIIRYNYLTCKIESRKFHVVVSDKTICSLHFRYIYLKNF